MEYEGVSIFRLLGFLGHNFMDSLFVFNSLFRCKFMLKSDQEQLTLMNIMIPQYILPSQM